MVTEVPAHIVLVVYVHFGLNNEIFHDMQMVS